MKSMVSMDSRCKESRPSLMIPTMIHSPKRRRKLPMMSQVMKKKMSRRTSIRSRKRSEMRRRGTSRMEIGY